MIKELGFPKITNVIKFVDCCLGTEIYFQGQAYPIVDDTVCVYTSFIPFPGEGGELLTGRCYIVSFINSELPPTYPAAPLFSTLYVIETIDRCTDLRCIACVRCYLLIPCDGSATFLTQNSDFETVVNTFVSVDSIVYTGTVYVVLLDDSTCTGAIDVVITEVPVDPCPTTCYYVQNSNGILYVDSSNVLQEISAIDAHPYVKICSKVYPVVDASSVDYLIIDLGLCDIKGCPQQCYKLVNCENAESVIYTNSDSVLPYLYGTNTFVQVAGREGCWEVMLLDPEEICDCPVDVIITSSYVDCLTCTGYTSYKLTSCIGQDVIYTLDDLSLYLDSVIKIYCGCYIVEQLDVLPPNPQSIVVDFTFNTCIECVRPYWKLIDCAGLAEDVYTYTDINTYVGKVIKIEGCDTCWEVESTEFPINPTTVTVTFDFDDCETCNVNILCQCSTLTNTSLTQQKYSYLDCYHNLIRFTLEPGESTDKICVLQFYYQPIKLPTDIIEYFGICQQGVCPQPVFINNRTVRPGYNTPICSPEKYDNITCHFADIIYKIVLEKRYGITNCCLEENDNWLMKKELIDLQALKDPNYICPACPCPCNSGKTHSTCNCGI
jgi:hypothetical protein